MSVELCEMALQQTQALLRLTETTMQEICCRKFSGSELYAEALRRVLGGKGKRGAACILISFQERHNGLTRGRVFHLVADQLVEGSEEVVIPTGSGYGADLAFAEEQQGVIAVNWDERSASVDSFQNVFPLAVRSFVGGAIRNFVSCRISGEQPGVITAFNYPGSATDYDASVLHGLAVVIGSLVTLSGEMRETEKAFIYTIEALARACEAAEEHTGTHILRVNRYAGALAANLGLPAHFVESISYSAQMHDVGKIKIPVTILLKEGPLNAAEMELMKMHPVFGERILGDSPRLEVAREIAIAHHENWDGSGYPYGLKGEQIPLAGRIVKIADVYDALRSTRSYKGAYSHAETVRVFRDGDERVRPADHFDPTLLATFFRIEHIFSGIYESLKID
ncbi:MAG: HD domain-containing protein [Geobacter sp.]|nr:HD domain-containing protein [Geobacter sp.]